MATKTKGNLDYNALIAEAKVHMYKIRRYEGQAAKATWALADLLAPIEVVNRGQNGKQEAEGISLIQLSNDLGVTKHWISQLRRTAKRFPPEQRLPDIGPSVHLAAYQRHGSTEAALEAMRALGDQLRVRSLNPEIEEAQAERLLRDPKLLRRIMPKLTEADREAISASMDEEPQSQQVVGRRRRVMADRAVTLATLRRARTMLSNVEIEEADEEMTLEIKALEEIVGRLVATVSANV